MAHMTHGLRLKTVLLIVAWPQKDLRKRSEDTQSPKQSRATSNASQRPRS